MIRANSTLADARYRSVFPQGKQTDSPANGRPRACLQLRRERIGIGRRTFCVSDARGIPKSANV